MPKIRIVYVLFYVFPCFIGNTQTQTTHLGAGSIILYGFNDSASFDSTGNSSRDNLDIIFSSIIGLGKISKADCNLLGNSKNKKSTSVGGNIFSENFTVQDVLANSWNRSIGALSRSDIIESANSSLEFQGKSITNCITKICEREIKVDSLGTVAVDPIFYKYYGSRVAKKVDKYMVKERHLPNALSTAEIAESGIHLRQMNLKFFKKVEEPTHYILHQSKEHTLLEIL